MKAPIIYMEKVATTYGRIYNTMLRSPKYKSVLDDFETGIVPHMVRKYIRETPATKQIDPSMIDIAKYTNTSVLPRHPLVAKKLNKFYEYAIADQANSRKKEILDNIASMAKDKPISARSANIEGLYRETRPERITRGIR